MLEKAKRMAFPVITSVGTLGLGINAESNASTNPQLSTAEIAGMGILLLANLYYQLRATQYIEDLENNVARSYRRLMTRGH